MFYSYNTHKFKYQYITKYELITKFPFKNVMEIPKLEKISLNFGLLKTLQNKKQIIPALLALELITLQKAGITRSKKQLYSYKIRKNMIVGAQVTLRKKNMDFFLEKFVTKALPNYQNFLGFQISRNNKNQRYVTLCLKDLNIFSELEAHHHLFSNLSDLNITLVFKNSPIFKKTNNILIFILNSLNIPIIFTKIKTK